MVRADVATPEYVPSFARLLQFAPPLVEDCHWQVVGDHPLKPTANVALWPVAAASSDGCPVSNGTAWKTPLRIVSPQ